MNEITVIGAGLAGCEAAWQAAERGARVRLIEMRPETMTPAHRTGAPAELVCSNSLGSSLPDRASGILHRELRAGGSLLLRCAEACAVPAGGALAVDRDRFSNGVAEALGNHPRIRVERAEARTIPDGIVVLASGPLTSPALSERLAEFMGKRHLFFYDAIAPAILADSLDRNIVFRASRHDRGLRPDGDYLNAPLDDAAYAALVQALRTAERIPLQHFEQDLAEGRGVRAGEGPHFEGCLPVEILAGRGDRALAFGPMRPVGLTDPRTGRWPRAVVQLRQEDEAGEIYGLVGFQTNLRQAEQRRVFRVIPGLERAEFIRYGQMHRNTFIQAPRLLRPTLQARATPRVLVAGQLAGFEGYAGSIASGWIAGLNASRLAAGDPPCAPPGETMMGALLYAVTCSEARRFQPVKANLGLFPPLPPGPRLGKRERARAHADRAARWMSDWLDWIGAGQER